MLRLSTEITFLQQPDFTNKIVYNYVNEIESENCWDNLTDTAKIVLPKKSSFKNNEIINGSNTLFKRGDKVIIKCGYFPNLVEIFNGYVVKLNISMPIEIECEDEMFILKQTKAKNYAGINIDLSTLIKNTFPSDLKVNALDINIGDWRVNNVTCAKVLDELREKHGLYSYTKDGVLNINLATDFENQKTGVFHFEKNIINSDNLKYQIAEQVKVKIKVNAFYSDNRKSNPIEIGDSDGDLRTINLYNVPEKDINTTATNILNKLKYDGYYGSFLTFGEPFVQAGDIANLISDVLPERNGKYRIKNVNRSFGMGGYRQKIELEKYIGK